MSDSLPSFNDFPAKFQIYDIYSWNRIPANRCTISETTELLKAKFLRPNIYLDIAETSANCEELKWFLHHIKETILSDKKTLIYCRTCSAVFNVCSWLVEEMGDQVYTGENQQRHVWLKCIIPPRIKRHMTEL